MNYLNLPFDGKSFQVRYILQDEMSLADNEIETIRHTITYNSSLHAHLQIYHEICKYMRSKN